MSMNRLIVLLKTVISGLLSLFLHAFSINFIFRAALLNLPAYTQEAVADEDIGEYARQPTQPV